MSTPSTPPALLTALKQTQHLIMSPQMQQAIHLLQVPVLELTEVIEQEMEQNPLLEYAEEEADEQEVAQEEEVLSVEPVSEEMAFDDSNFSLLQQLEDEFSDHWEQSSTAFGQPTEASDKLHAFLENSLSHEESLYEHLLQQVQETLWTQNEQALAKAIIGSLDDSGFLSTSLAEIAIFCGCKEQELVPILATIQTFDPPGVGARSLQETLLLQLRQRGKSDSRAYRLISEHYEALLHNHIPVISKALHCTAEEVAHIVEREIATLDLHPGLTYGRATLQPLIADVALRVDDEDKLVVEVNDEYIPSLRLNKGYMRLLREETLSKEAKDFIKQKVLAAKWLLRNILQRNDTIARIAGVLAQRQHVFLLVPHGKLVPLTMRQVAEELGLHESTVARAVANKYIDTPRGLLALRFFFTNTYVTAAGDDISSDTVRQAVAELIEGEDKQHPYSDHLLSQFLHNRGITCARRTVAKYRIELGFGNAQQRRKYCSLQ